MQKLIIDRNIWLRGETSFHSFLLREKDQKQCCVGIYLEQCGVERTSLSGITVAYKCNNLPQKAEWLVNPGNEAEVQDLYCINDKPAYSDSGRESLITKAFAKHDVEVEFVN